MAANALTIPGHALDFKRDVITTGTERDANGDLWVTIEGAPNATAECSCGFTTTGPVEDIPALAADHAAAV